MPTRVVQSYSKEVQFLSTCCEQRVTYLVIGISALELESTFLETCRAAVHDTESLTRSLEDSESVSQSLLPSWRALK
jgi:hypothetical protein